MRGKGDEGLDFLDGDLIKEIKVTKVSQEDVLQKNSLDVYYYTTKLPQLQTLVKYTLTLEQISLETRIRDT